MRDNVLVQAQSQIDAIATQMSSALSDTTTAGSAVSVGAQNGFDTDVGSMLAGNTTTVTYTDASNVQHTISIMRVDDPSVLPLSNAATTDPNDTVVGIDFSGGMASVVTQLNAALGATGLQFSNPVRHDAGGARQRPGHHHRQFRRDDDDGDVALRRVRRAAAVHRRRLRPIPAPSPRRARRARAMPGASRSTAR